MEDQEREAYRKMIRSINEKHNRENRIDGTQNLLNKMAERIDSDKAGTPVG